MNIHMIDPSCLQDENSERQITEKAVAESKISQLGPKSRKIEEEDWYSTVDYSIVLTTI